MARIPEGYRGPISTRDKKIRQTTFDFSIDLLASPLEGREDPWGDLEDDSTMLGNPILWDD